MEKIIKNSVLHDVAIIPLKHYTEISQNRDSGQTHFVIIDNNKLPELIEFLTSIVNEQNR